MTKRSSYSVQLGLHANDKPLETLSARDEFFFHSLKKGWLWSDLGKSPYSTWKIEEAEEVVKKLSRKFPKVTFEVFERKHAYPSRRQTYYRVRALFTPKDLHDFRGQLAGQKYGF